MAIIGSFETGPSQTIDSTALVVILLAVITTIVAPTWMSWWNARQTKRQVEPNGGTSMRDVLDRVVIIQHEHTDTLKRQDKQLNSIASKVRTNDDKLKSVQDEQSRVAQQLANIVVPVIIPITEEIVRHITEVADEPEKEK